MTTTLTFTELAGAAGKELGYSNWVEITQDRINTFADATDDHQWIHTDVEKAKEGPFGGPIAHGFLTLSLAIPMWTDILDVTECKTKVNYGLDKVRFISPVRAGSRIRMSATVAEVLEIAGGVQITVDQTIEIEGVEKPAAAARALYRFYA